MNITPETSLGEIVKNNFRAIRVLEKYNLDYCCGGKKLFSNICTEKGLNAEEITKELAKIENEYVSDKFNFWPMSFLCDYIKVNHHDYLRRVFPVISQHIDKVVNAHGERFDYLPQLKEVFEKIREELLSHMEKEERVLFPYISGMDKLYRGVSFPPFGNVETPISVLIREHEEAGGDIELLKQITNNFTPPENACTTFKVTFNELDEFYRDLKIHIHLENNILFPKAIEIESGIRN